MLQQITIELHDHQYPIYLGVQGLSNAELLRSLVPAGQAFIVTNETVAPLYLPQVEAAFDSIQCDVLILPDGEVYKNQHSLNQIYNALIERRHHRDTTLFALGGGVIGDMTGFAAATYQRGVRYIQLPTTLLSQVDSSIGGKTAINHASAKNMIGSFYQPHAVIMDLNTLHTLPDREFRSGFAEVIKCAWLAGDPFFQRLRQTLEAGLASISLEQLSQLILDCCRVKARFVQQDEKETGQRALLNLGHTFAHALEAYTNYQRWRHGEAVAIGLYCAAFLSNQLGILTQADLSGMDDLLRYANLPRRIPTDIDLHQFMQWMQSDKKVKNKKIRFVLMAEPGVCHLDESVSEDEVYRALVGCVQRS